MRERPIPYSPPMVRARRAGLKTNTRRAIDPQPPEGCGKILCGTYHPSILGKGGVELQGDPVFGAYSKAGEWGVRCPYGQPGDHLWVREAWRTLASYDALPPRDVPPDAPIWYEADGKAPDRLVWGRYRHGRFMMRWMSRGIDKIVSIRTEMLNDISEADAKAEGVVEHWLGQDRRCNVDGWVMVGGSPIYAYRRLWEEINGADTWAKNPLVWVVEFEVIK